MKFNMFDDFRFIFPRKIDKYKNKHKLECDFNKVNKEYCLNSFVLKTGRPINHYQYLKNNFTALIDGVAIFEKNNHEEITKGLKTIIYKKNKIFKQMQGYNNEIFIKNKKMGFLSFSLRLSKAINRNMAEHTEILRKSLIRFFNNMRSKKFYSSDVVGYFWVMLQDNGGFPYMHVVFHFKNNDFNALVGHEIIETWIRVVNFYKVEGELLFLNATEDFTNGTGIYCLENKGEILTMKTYSTNTDWNDVDYALFKQFKGYNKKLFDQYLYALAKKSYFINPKGRAVGFSSIKD
ncbi:hypothetical protein LPW36_04015 [Jinshanibacter sp. LJY008]|uniref:Uncharacterized protein n=1 Tax=Limnobaculum eriocheiris TaxID=2897391 RepID=A0A9X1MUI7_9GAMM|nr:hypothetical protein [Limnobaculum eriocheiris]MCD1125199.1 hypothetical protein [Limnobaculum eriocheiris]